MSWFPDLSPYSYSSFSMPGTLNIGWLEPRRLFFIDPTSEAFRERLGVLCRKHFVNRSCGSHPCFFCGKAASSAEVHVAGVDGQVYAAPMLIHHYVVAHAYRPPDEFIEAVLHGSIVNPEPSDPEEIIAHMRAEAKSRREKRE